MTIENIRFKATIKMTTGNTLTKDASVVIIEEV